MRLLATLFGRIAEAADDYAESHVTDARLSELAMSHGDLAKLLRDALKAHHPGDGMYCWVRDVFDDSVVYELSNKEDQMALYQRTYAVADGAVTFGEPVRVIAVTQYLPAEQAEVTVPVTQLSQPAEMPAAEAATEELVGDLVPLIEQAVKADGSAKIKIIRAGQGSSGWYPEDVLKRDAAVFAADTHIYADHPTVTEESERPERSVKDLIGSLTGPAIWEASGSDGPGLYAPVRFVDTVAPLVNGLAPIAGMSIRASGTVGTREIDGKKVRSIESIDAVHSVDLVTKPGAGGKIVALMESARQRQPGTPAIPPREAAGMTIEEALAALEEAKTRLGEANTRIEEQEREIGRLRERNVLREADAVIAETLAGFELHEMTRERLTKALKASPPIKDGDLDTEAFTARVTEAAKTEMNYLAVSTNGSGVRGMGGGTAEGDARADLIAAFKEAGYPEEIAARMAG